MWIVSIVGALLGAAWFLLGTLFGNSAVQDAAVAGQALVLAVIPYIIARALSEQAAERRRRDGEEV
jgi:hypothetical protein